MRFSIGAILAALFLTMTIQVDAQTVLFDFRATGGAGVLGAPPNFDPSIAGDTVTVGGLNLTIADITFPEYELVDSGEVDDDGAPIMIPQETGVTLSAAAGDGGSTSVGNGNSLGLNNPSVNNSNFDRIGNGGEGNDINPGEAITMTFDEDVEFTAIELESVIPEDSFNVLVDGEAVLETTGVDGALELGGLTDLTIAAGTEITFAVDGVLETATGGPATSIRIETFTVVGSESGEVVYTFQGNGGVVGTENLPNFDPGSAGDVVTIGGLGGLDVTIVDITAPEYNLDGALPVETGNILSSAAGDAVTTEVSAQDALGIDNPSIENEQFDIIGDGNDSTDLNPGESVTITFGQDVQFTAIELESVQAADVFNVLVAGETVLETMGDDGFIDDLGSLAGLTIAAGTEVTFAVDGVLENATDGPTTSIRIETFTVEIIESDDGHGDVNLDGIVNFLDISPFITVLAAGGSPAAESQADCNGDGTVSFLDISPFIQALASAGS